MPLGIMEVGLGEGHNMLDGDPAPLLRRWAQRPNFRPMSIVAKRSPISATAEHYLLFYVCVLRTVLHLNAVRKCFIRAAVSAAWHLTVLLDFCRIYTSLFLVFFKQIND